jgi:large subunit ribosomal protein L23
MKKIARPIVSEKSFLLASVGKYSFAASRDYSKEQAKSAIENLYAVNVEKINTINVTGKMKIAKGKSGKRQNIKKFIFTLKTGQKIDLFDIEEKAKESKTKAEKLSVKTNKNIGRDRIKPQVSGSRLDNNPTALSKRGGE